jgi:hypothetical protein
MTIDRAAAQAAMAAARAAAGPLAAKVFRYSDLIESTVKAAKDPAFTAAGWADLEALIAVDSFERVGNFKERMDWPTYRAMLTQWGTTTEFWSNFRAITEAGNRVFLELEEHNTPHGAPESVANSLSVYEFDAAGQLCHLDIYLQYVPPGMAAPTG